ncbi:hypothetical protein B0H19DRAFT_1102483 [Mycena capillaripes]|nr:hypothetical protein B0H19DRAFT_1102483 [Mycena capillaripes]
MPLSPGFASAELAELLAEAAALEQRLERGELPGEALRRRSMRPPPRNPNTGAGDAPPMPPLPPVPHEEGTALRPQRASSFRNPLARSRSDGRVKGAQDGRAHVTPASSSMGNLLAMQDAVAGASGSRSGVSVGAAPGGGLARSKTSAQLLPVPASPALSMGDVPPTPPPKSPGFGGGTRYFSSLRRLASTSTSRTMPGAGAGARGSVSTTTSSELSSEDSMGLPTPPDDGGHPPPSPHLSPQSSPHVGSGIAWPSLGSKKSVGSLGRGAASLAGKMWHRSRSKSSTSTVSSLSEASSPPPVPVPVLPTPPALKLDSTPFVIPPIQTTSYDHEHDPSDSPTSSTPIADPFSSLSTAIPTASTSVPKQIGQRPPALVLTSSTSAPASLLPVPKTAPEKSRQSWTSSISSTGSSSVATSPLFDKAIFDAFPSVPEMPPPSRPLPMAGRSKSLRDATSSGNSSPASSSPTTGSVRPLPLSPQSYSSHSDTSSMSERSFAPSAGSYGRDGLLARVAETQRRVNPLP